MSTTTDTNPGLELQKIREKRGFTKEYVAGKLHLRVKLIELLEADEYAQMPQPVFIMGYIRAYAKLLSVTPEPYIEAYNKYYLQDQEPEKALWQRKRESNKNEVVVRWVTGMVAILAVMAISFWWHQNTKEHPVVAAKKAEPEVAVSEVSKMQSMFS